MSKSILEGLFHHQIVLLGAPHCERDHRFAAEHVGGAGAGIRKRLAEAGLQDWRFDFSWPDKRLAVEIDGGTWTQGRQQGRHTRGAGYADGCRKTNAATLLGWRVLRFTSDMVSSGEAARVTIEALK